MDTRKAGAMGAKITNAKLTKEGRSKAAKKGWRRRKIKKGTEDFKNRFTEVMKDL